MDRMEKPPLQTFVTWQKAVRLAAHLYRLSWAEEHRPVATPPDPSDWEMPLGGCAELYTRLHVAELSGALTEREARGLLGQCEELERHLQGVRRTPTRTVGPGADTTNGAWPAPRPRLRG
jgi:hypothetical protein